MANTDIPIYGTFRNLSSNPVVALASEIMDDTLNNKKQSLINAELLESLGDKGTIESINNKDAVKFINGNDEYFVYVTKLVAPTLPTLTLNYNPNATATSVTLTVSNGSYDSDSLLFSFDGGTTWTANKTFSFTNNGKVQTKNVRMKATLNGVATPISSMVDIPITITPKIVIPSNTDIFTIGSYNQFDTSVNITYNKINSTPAQSTIKILNPSTNEYTESFSTNTYTRTITSSGSYTCRVKYTFDTSAEGAFENTLYSNLSDTVVERTFTVTLGVKQMCYGWSTESDYTKIIPTSLGNGPLSITNPAMNTTYNIAGDNSSSNKYLWVCCANAFDVTKAYPAATGPTTLDLQYQGSSNGYRFYRSNTTLGSNVTQICMRN